ncbi:MAG: peptidoglycan-binding domain-containing protein [Candidatus Taylorbacteria bacterium]
MNISRLITVSLFVTSPLFVGVTFVNAQQSDFVPTLGPSSDTTTIPSTIIDTGTEGSTTLIASTTGSNTAEGGTTLVPSNGGSNNAEGGTTLVPTVGGQNGDEIGTQNATDTQTGGSSNSFGGGSSGGSFVGISANSIASTTTSCPLITTYMTFGGNNNASDVSKLQAYLKNVEGLNVDVTGVYDQKTVDAVKAFQDKYHNDTMGPWGAALASGRVYITTLKKINQLACSSALTLSADELAIIDSYKNTVATGTSTPGSIGQGTTTPQVGTNGTNGANTAAAANAPVLQRFWNFLKSIF